MVVVFFKKEPLIMLFAEANGITELQPPLKWVRATRRNINIRKNVHGDLWERHPNDLRFTQTRDPEMIHWRPVYFLAADELRTLQDHV